MSSFRPRTGEYDFNKNTLTKHLRPWALKSFRPRTGEYDFNLVYEISEIDPSDKFPSPYWGI